jgi:thioredoxin reductase (NADPH)
MANADYDVLIIGSGPAGLTAGLYCSRAKLKTVIIEKANLGGNIINAEVVENFPGFPQGISGAELSSNMISQVLGYGVELKQSEVTSIGLIGGFKEITATDGQYLAKAVIVAGGGRRKKLGVPGEDEFVGKGISFCAMCDGNRFAGKAVAVIGGGDGGLSEGLYLAKLASKVTIIEIDSKLHASAVLQEKARVNPKVDILSSTTVEEISGDTEVKSIVIKNVETGSKSNLRVSGVLFAIGLEPEVEYLQGMLELDSDGYIVVTRLMETNVPGIFAAGDIRSESVRQAVAAAGDGAVAAVSAENFIRRM